MGGMRARLPLVSAPAEVECRQCGVVCEKVVHPQRCLEQSCPFLYAHELFGRTFVGCMQKVFAAEIDLELLERVETVAGEDGKGVAEFLVAGGEASAQVVVIHGGEVVVDE